MSSTRALSSTTVPLSHGLHIPIFGLGTSHDGGYSHDAIVYALTECGVRHIDTAKRYGCEEKLGEAITESGIPRSDLWITTKLWPGDYGYTAAKKACLDSCSHMGVDYFDLYLMHWPDSLRPGCSNRKVRADTWRALEDLYKEGVCRAIGVSNFMIHHLEQLLEDCSVVPHVNQVEYHPFQQPHDLIDYCRQKGIVFEGYSPLAKGQVLSNPTILQIAEKYRRTPSQICIRWSIQNGVVTIPKSTKRNRIKENCENDDLRDSHTGNYYFKQLLPKEALLNHGRYLVLEDTFELSNFPQTEKVFDFQLEAADMLALGGLHDGRHVTWDPTNIE